MRKILICLLGVVFGLQSMAARETSEEQDASGAQNTVRVRPRYFNLCYGNQTFKIKDWDESLKSDYAFAITRGRTYYLHKKPIVGLIKFGIDWTHFDLNFATYTREYEDVQVNGDPEIEKDNAYELEAAMHVGPSITVSPVKGLNINGYFRYAPSFSGYYDSDDFYYNYASFFVAGGAVSYKVISLGIESRWGNTEYKYEGKEDEAGNAVDEKVKIAVSGVRFYLSFRF